MSVTRPPIRSHQHERELDGLDDLEELGDDAIIAQQTEAHALKPRVNIADDARSVVITDHPKRDTQPPRGSGLPRASGEATLVIRDRRALDELRKNIFQRQVQKKQGNRALYKWGALGLAAFVLGGLVALLATDPRAEAPAAAASALGTSRVDVQASMPSAEPTPAATIQPHTVRLDDLPIESKH